MFTTDDARSRVARGAAHLDRRWPGWWAQINLERLAMSSCARCVLGQLFRDFEFGVERLGLEFPSPDGSSWARWHRAVQQGFVLSDTEYRSDASIVEPYRILQDAWIEEIAARHVAAAIVPEEARSTEVSQGTAV